MNPIFRATGDFMAQVRQDLMRPHRHAAERVGFITVRAANAGSSLLLLAQDYFPVADEEYVVDYTAGATISQEALRKALEIALLNPVGIFHTHMHLLPERLWFSRIDLREQYKFVPDFFKVRPGMPHGALVLSPHNVAGRAWLAPDKIEHIAETNIVGARVQVSKAARDGSMDFYS